MSHHIQLPANMRALADNQSQVAVAGETVGQALQELVNLHPDLASRLLNESGQLQSYVNVFVDQQSVRGLQELETPLGPDSEILIVAALAGG